MPIAIALSTSLFGSRTGYRRSARLFAPELVIDLSAPIDQSTPIDFSNDFTSSTQVFTSRTTYARTYALIE
jgi:hypothetical protein